MCARGVTGRGRSSGLGRFGIDKVVKGSTIRMKKRMLLTAVLLMSAAGFAQESRQDVSLSAVGVFQPQEYGNAVHQNTTGTVGALVSYRFMLTPRSALEANYGFAQNSQNYVSSPYTYRIHSRQQELSAAYVLNFNFRNFNPFIEVGAAGVVFSDLKDYRTTILDSGGTKTLGGLYGAGIAYELSPSFDIRMQYRGLILKSPNFGVQTLKTNAYTNISEPTVGIAYHF